MTIMNSMVFLLARCVPLRMIRPVDLKSCRLNTFKQTAYEVDFLFQADLRSWTCFEIIGKFADDFYLEWPVGGAAWPWNACLIV